MTKTEAAYSNKLPGEKVTSNITLEIIAKKFRNNCRRHSLANCLLSSFIFSIELMLSMQLFRFHGS